MEQVRQAAGKAWIERTARQRWKRRLTVFLRQAADMLREKIRIPAGWLEDFCRRWKIVELSVFGSALREDFHPDSDLDLLVSFAPEAAWSLLDHVAMEEEISRTLGRKVDLVSRRSVERSPNWIRRKAILESAEPYFVRPSCTDSS
jgi:predicted nucleotidyltransferase